MIEAGKICGSWRSARYASLCVSLLFVLGCAGVDIPDVRKASVPEPVAADQRERAINETPESVIYLPLGEDVLVPEVAVGDDLPDDVVGPYELRSETIAGALQLLVSDYDVALAFESDLAFSRRITVANLRGPLNRVVGRACSLADLYCSYEDGVLVVKERQTFTVRVPPISQDESFISNVATGLAAIIGSSPIVDPSTRTIIYEASQRTATYADRYFQRMRSSTALIVFETYIWEVNLDNENSSGIRWDGLSGSIGKYMANAGMVGTDFSAPVSIGLSSGGNNLSSQALFEFLSTFGAVKTISQPKITVLSGSEAYLRVADTQNYIADISRTINADGQITSASVSPASVDSGFELRIASSWDNSTVYADISIDLTDVIEIDTEEITTGTGAEASVTRIGLPRMSERELTTQVRVRPGDSLLIAGLVREADNYRGTGPGFNRPLLFGRRVTSTENRELVFLMRPRVVVYTNPQDGVRQPATSSAREPRGGAVVSERPVAAPAQAEQDYARQDRVTREIVPSYDASLLDPAGAPF